MTEEGWCSFTVEGYCEENPLLVQKSVTDRLYVSFSEKGQDSPITPDEAMQLHNELEKIIPTVNEMIDEVKASTNEVCQRIEFWSEYDVSTSYKKGNKVSFQGKSYVCIKDVCGISPTDTEFWLIISDRGEKGPTGAQGPQGVRGERGYKGDRGEKGDKGDKGEQGVQGVHGLSVRADGFYSFDVDSQGDLWVHYPDSSNPPSITINENGELIIDTDANSYNLGTVKGKIPIKGVDYFTSEDIAALNIPVVDDAINEESQNPVQNAVIAAALNKKADQKNESGGFWGGFAAKARLGGAVGGFTETTEGFAGGCSAESNYGGAVGYCARTGDGFAGGFNAETSDDDNNVIDAIQLGSGINKTPKTFQVYSTPVLDENGKLYEGVIPDFVKQIDVEIGDNGNWYINEEDTGKPSRGYSGLVPQQNSPYSANVTIPSNTMINFDELEGAFDVSLAEGVKNYDNEWDFTITQGATAYDVVLPVIEWGLGIAPTFSANTTTLLRLYYVGQTLCGEWVCV